MKGIHVRSEEVTEDQLNYTKTVHVPSICKKANAWDNERR